MIGFVRRGPRNAQGDDGIALVVAMALVAVVGVLIASVVFVAMYETRATGRDRQRSQAVAAAEQVVDTLMAQVQGAALATVPCGTTTSTASVGADRLDVETEVTYFDVNGNEIADCNAVRAGTTRAYQAHIASVATSEAIADQVPAQRQVETLVELRPAYANAMTHAIFGDNGINFDNHTDIKGENGQPNADLYTNDDFTCNNNMQIHGSVYAQNDVTMANSCTVMVDVHAGTSFRADNPQVTVNGRIMVANGNVTFNANMKVGQQVLASGSILPNATAGPCAQAGKCFPGATVPPVPAQAFPVFNSDTATINQWVAQGYTNVVKIGPGGNAGAPFNQCGWYNGPTLNRPDGKKFQNADGDYAAAWIFANGYQLPGPTILISECGQGLSMQGSDIKLNNNLLVFSDYAMTFSNKTIITSTTGDQRYLYLVQPHDTPASCSGDGIRLDNQVTVDATVDVLLYSPCDIRKANNTTHFGQIYSGGRANINNKFDMEFRQLPVFGLGGSNVIESYSLDILYKRENV